MCLYDDGDDYGIKLVQRGERHAIREHTCSECGRTIDPGERYQFWVTVGGDQGGWVTSKMCAHCWGTIELGAALTGSDPPAAAPPSPVESSEGSGKPT